MDEELLRTRLAALEAEVARLRAAHEALAAERRRPTMRAAVACTGCGCRRLLHATEVLDRGASGREAMALVQPSAWLERTVGCFEAFVCTGCGLVEWYVRDVADIKPNDKTIRVVEGDVTTEGDARGPYR